MFILSSSSIFNLDFIVSLKPAYASAIQAFTFLAFLIAFVTQLMFSK